MVVIRSPIFATPDVPAALDMRCRRLVFPFHLVDQLGGAISLLLNEDLWYVKGNESIEASVEYFDQMWLEMTEGCTVIGEIKPHALETLPTNWLDCDGATYLRVDYPDLYAAIDTDLIIDADNFRVPNLQQNFPLGKSAANLVGQSGGAATVTLSTPQMPAHTHQGAQYAMSPLPVAPGPPLPFNVLGPPISGQTGSRGGGLSHNNMPPFEVVKYAIIAG